MEFNVLAHAAWAPSLPDGDAWVRWANGGAAPEGTDPPDLSHIKPMQRRRLSLTARAVFAVGYDCLQAATEPSDVICIFCNSYGPTPMTANMLENIARAEPISPTSFSISVHNAIAGQFSIAHGITAPSSTIAPGQGGVGTAFIDAAGWLHGSPEREILLCFYEEPLDERLKPYEEPLPAPMATAALITGGTELKFTRTADSSITESVPYWRQVLGLGAFLAGAETDLDLASNGVRYQWQKHS